MKIQLSEHFQHLRKIEIFLHHFFGSPVFSVEFLLKVHILVKHVVKAIISEFFMHPAYVPLLDVFGMGVGKPEKPL